MNMYHCPICYDGKRLCKCNKKDYTKYYKNLKKENNYLNLNRKNLTFCMEWSGCQYIAIDCKKKNDEHYPKVVYEINGDVSDWKKIHSVKLFDMKEKSIEYFCKMVTPWNPTRKEIDNILKVVNMVPPS